jgi:hypothetical protein
MPETTRLCLIGPYAGQLIKLDDATAATALADGWARDITHMPYETTDIKLSVPMWKWPQSLRDWLKLSWFNIDAGGIPPVESFSCPVESVSNSVDPIVRVSAADFPNFLVGTMVQFTGTGNAVLDDTSALFTVISVNNTGKTFRISTDLSSESSPIQGGTITTVPQQSPIQAEFHIWGDELPAKETNNG